MTGPILAWLEGSGLAGAVRDSLLLTASLSAVHLLGVTLVGGGALVSGLRLGGLMFTNVPFDDVVRPASRAIFAGLAVNVATGLLLFAPRASMAAENGFFQLKMSLLVAGAVCQGLLYSRARSARTDSALTRSLGVAASVLLFGVVVTGAAYILLE